MKRLYPLIYFIWTWVLPIQGQHGDLLFHHLGVNDGLSEASNLYVYKDVRGFVWISSALGLNRFDGTAVTTYYPDPENPCAIEGENIQSSFFEEDSSGLWFSTYKALNRYDWKTDCFEAFKIYSGRDTLSEYHAFYLDGDQNLWLLCDQFIYTFSIKTHTFNLIGRVNKKSQRAVVVADDHRKVTRLWAFLYNEVGAEEITIGPQHQLVHAQRVWDSTSTHSFRIKQMLTQGDSLIWALADNTLIRYNPRHDQTRFIPFHQGLATTFEFLNDSMLLIGFAEQGMWTFNVNQEEFVDHYQHSPEDRLSLISNAVNYISRDRADGVWIGSRGIGLSYSYPGKRKFNTFFPGIAVPAIKEFFPAALVPVQQDLIWCATRSNGFYFIQRQGPTSQLITRDQRIDPRALQGIVYDVVHDRGDQYWIMTFPGLTAYDAGTGQLVHVSREHQVALSGMPWSDRKMLFCGKGLFEVEGTMNTGFNLTWNPRIPDTVDYLPLWLDRRGRLWINEKLHHFLILDSIRFDTLTTLPIPGFCTQMAESDDAATLWISSSSGLYEIDAEALHIRKVYNHKNGFPAAGFTSMMKDLDGRLWLTFNAGIVMYDPARDSVRVFTEEDGLPSLQYTNAACRLDDGEIWFAAMQGITRFYPDRIRDIQIGAMPQITEIQVNDKAPVKPLICGMTGATNIPLIQKLTFTYRENTLALRVNALEYTSPSNNQVKYQMEGLDGQPLLTANGSLVRYPNLPPGNYRFVIYAANSDGVFNPSPHVLLICIIPPYYKTWWFAVLVILLAGSLLAYIIYLRFSKTLELQRVRLKLYENLHDDVGSRLTAIVLSTEDLEHNEKIIHPKIQSISKISKSIVDNMRRLVWAIDPENDRMYITLQKIMHDKSLILDESISFQLKVDDQLKNMIVPGEVRYQISSICNEAFNNISKYAKATAVTVSLAREQKTLHMRILDNGIGFDPDQTSKHTVSGSGYGLNNMKRRASRVKGRLEVISKPGAGTRIEVYFPI